MAAKTALLEKLTLSAPHLTTKSLIPAFVYGTAWKKDATTDLVFQALSHGFTAIDTACQPKHYREDLVGEGLRKAISQNFVKRCDVYIQTKFTSVDGQDPNNMPYDPQSSLVEQVKTSLEVSLRNFNIPGAGESGASETYLDAVVLHSPMRNMDDTMEVWHTLESYVPHRILNIGISNCDLFTLMNIYERATIKPSVVQNRFYRQTKFDIGVRKFCHDKNIVYQSFWTLSANPELLRSQPVKDLASQLSVSRESALYCLVLGLGKTVVLNGTTNIKHMEDDWAALAAAEGLISCNEESWKTLMGQFLQEIGQPPLG